MIIEMISKYLEFKGIAVYLAEKEIGVGAGVLAKAIRNNSNVGTNVLENLLKKYVDINPEWLLTGKGSMLRDAQATAMPIVQEQAQHPCQELLKQVDMLQATILELKQDKASLQATITSQQEQISFFLLHNKELEEVLLDYKSVIDKPLKKPTAKPK